MRKIGIIVLLIFGCFLSNIEGQSVEVKPYTFVSRAKDTVQTELWSFKVLENRKLENSDSITLYFLRFKSTNPNPGSPIIYLAGGPGGSGIATARGKRFELFMKLREVADVIAFDQRGTGMSNSFTRCPETIDIDISEPITKKNYINKTIAYLKKCISFWNKNNRLYAYNTTENAKDLDELRKVLKSDKISFWGISYGSHLAFEYIRLFEKNINKVVLASLEGTDETIKLPANTEKFIDIICERAKDNYGNEPKYPNLKNKIIEVHKRLKKESVKVAYQDRKGKSDTVGISNFDLQIVVSAFYLKNPENSKKLPKLYSKLYEGNFQIIAPQVKLVKKYIGQINPMSFAMDMQSGISQSRKEIVDSQQKLTVLGNSINFLYYDWMSTYDFPMLPDEFRTMKENNVKALLLSGTMDGRTYVSSAKEIAKKFKRGKHIIIKNAGHDLYMSSPLIGDMILDFLKGKEIQSSKLALDPILFE